MWTIIEDGGGYTLDAVDGFVLARETLTCRSGSSLSSLRIGDWRRQMSMYV